MIRKLFGCCDDLVFTDPYERRPRHPAFDGPRGSRFLEVTSDPLNMISNKIPLVAKNNNTFDAQVQPRFDTRASDSNQGEARKGLEHQQFKPRTPIMELQCLMQSRARVDPAPPKAPPKLYRKQWY